MKRLQHITNASRKLKKICLALTFYFPSFVLFYWVFFNNQTVRGLRALPFSVESELSSMCRFFAFLIEIISLSVIVYGLMKLRELFSLYEKGIIFTKKNVVCFMKLGWSLIAWTISDVVRNILFQLLLPIDPSSPIHYIPFQTGYIVCIFVGIIILIISWIMDEARIISDEQSLFL